MEARLAELTEAGPLEDRCWLVSKATWGLGWELAALTQAMVNVDAVGSLCSLTENALLLLSAEMRMFLLSEKKIKYDK